MPTGLAYSFLQVIDSWLQSLAVVRINIFFCKIRTVYYMLHFHALLRFSTCSLSSETLCLLFRVARRAFLARVGSSVPDQSREVALPLE